MIGGPHNTRLMRQLANRRMTAVASVYRSPAAAGGRIGAAVLLQASAPAYVYEPSTPAALTLLSDLGSVRANWIGEMRFDADVIEGDELHIGAMTYQIERVVARPDLTLLALWEVRN